MIHDHQPVAQLLRFVHVVGGQDERHALLLEAVEPVPEEMPCLGVEPGGRLVEQQQVGLVDEPPGDDQASLHAPREWLDLVAGALRELDEVEQLPGARPRLRVRQVEVAPVDEQVLLDRELHVQAVLLGHDTEAGADRGAVRGRIQAEHPQRAVGDRRDAADHAHRARLARAVRPQEPERLARRHLEIDGVHGRGRAEALRQGARKDQGFDIAGHRLMVPEPTTVQCQVSGMSVQAGCRTRCAARLR